MEDKLKSLSSNQEYSLDELVEILNLKYDYLSSKIEELSLKAVVKKDIKFKEIIIPGEKLLEGKKLPESILLEIVENAGEIKLSDLKEKSRIPDDDFNAGLAVLIRSGVVKTFKRNTERWIKIDNLDNKEEILVSEDVLEMVREKGRVELSSFSEKERRIVEKLLKRPGYLKKTVD